MSHICRPHSSSLMFAPPRLKKRDALNSSWVSGPSLDLVCGVFCQGFVQIRGGIAVSTSTSRFLATLQNFTFKPHFSNDSLCSSYQNNCLFFLDSQNIWRFKSNTIWRIKWEIKSVSQCHTLNARFFCHCERYISVSGFWLHLMIFSHL